MTSLTETSSYPFSWPSSWTLWACGDGLWLSIKSVPILVISIILGFEKKNAWNLRSRGERNFVKLSKFTELWAIFWDLLGHNPRLHLQALAICEVSPGLWLFFLSLLMASYTRNHFEASIKRWKHLCSRECLDHSISSIILYSTWTRFGFHGIAKALTTLRGSKRGTEICGSYFRKHDTRTMCRGNCTDGTFASHSLLDPMCWFSQGSNLVTHIWQSCADPTALTVCLPVCLFIYLSVGWSVCLSI